MVSLSTAFALPAEPIAACAAVTPVCNSPGIHDVAADVTLAKDPLEDDSLDLVEQLSPGNPHQDFRDYLKLYSNRLCEVNF